MNVKSEGRNQGLVASLFDLMVLAVVCNNFVLTDN